MAKKPVKKTASKKTTKKVTRKRAVVEIKPIKKEFSKTEFINRIAEKTELAPKQVKAVLGMIETAMLGSIAPGGLGYFTMHGLFKVQTKKIPARKAGTLVRNPATGEMIKGKAKPASVRVKIRALTKIRKAAIGG